MDPKFGMPKFTIIHKAPNEVRFHISRPAYGGMEGWVKGTGYLALANGVKVTVKKVDRSGAVLRFQRKTMDPDNDQVSASDGGGIISTG
ncbi:hypothetical protein ABZ897_32545 [Nonomuraea sp. NPDC046802]|uniref:hypothetical protein n=1 Tax=Nonomuraea sp. NPDC046802 TaxID=3154919 RepID=UPI0033DC45C9